MSVNNSSSRFFHTKWYSDCYIYEKVLVILTSFILIGRTEGINQYFCKWTTNCSPLADVWKPELKLRIGSLTKGLLGCSPIAFFAIQFFFFYLCPSAGWDTDGEVVGPDWDVSWLSSHSRWALCTMLHLTSQEVLQVCPWRVMIFGVWS